MLYNPMSNLHIHRVSILNCLHDLQYSMSLRCTRVHHHLPGSALAFGTLALFASSHASDAGAPLVAPVAPPPLPLPRWLSALLSEFRREQGRWKSTDASAAAVAAAESWDPLPDPAAWPFWPLTPLACAFGGEPFAAANRREA